MLTVAQLKELIADLPDDMEIAIDDMERGLMPTIQIEIISIKKTPTPFSSYGYWLQKDDSQPNKILALSWTWNHPEN